jgi:hypothetical protein
VIRICYFACINHSLSNTKWLSWRRTTLSSVNYHVIYNCLFIYLYLHITL